MTGKADILQVRDGAVTVVAPLGRLDAASAPHLRSALEALDAAGERRIVVDLAGVDYISSAGLGALFAFAKRMHEVGGALALCALGEQVRRVFDLAGYIPHFTVIATRADAVAHVGR